MPLQFNFLLQILKCFSVILVDNFLDVFESILLDTILVFSKQSRSSSPLKNHFLFSINSNKNLFRLNMHQNFVNIMQEDVFGEEKSDDFERNVSKKTRIAKFLACSIKV